MWELTEQGALRDRIWMANPGTATNKGHLHLCGRDQCVNYIISTLRRQWLKKKWIIIKSCIILFKSSVWLTWVFPKMLFSLPWNIYTRESYIYSLFHGYSFSTFLETHRFFLTSASCQEERKNTYRIFSQWYEQTFLPIVEKRLRRATLQKKFVIEMHS